MLNFEGNYSFLLTFVQFYWFEQKQMFKQIKIFLWICTFWNLLWKTNFLSISEHLSERVTFLIKREVVFSEFSRKCFKITGKHNLAVCGSFCGEKQFLLKFVPFYCLNKNSCLQRIQFFLWIFSISNLLRKVIFLSNSDLFEQKENFSVYFPENSSKLQESIVCLYVANFEEKNIFLLTFVHFYWFEEKKMFKPIKIFLWIFPFFKLVEKKKFLSISVLLSERVYFWLKEKFSVKFPRNAAKQPESIF